MTRSHTFLPGPFFAALLAAAFCVWTALGNDVNICVTTGCTLFQDFSIYGISLWWFGTAAFSFLAICALLGLCNAGLCFSALFLLGDTALLALMSLTAPCVNCLIVAIFFAVSYYLFRAVSYNMTTQKPANRPHSLLILAWGIFFTINIGMVARSQLDVWPILDESGDAKGKVFFSPSCPHCVDTINALSGNINYAFYPIAENDNDVYRIAKMEELLKEGQSLSQALGQSGESREGDFISSLSPSVLLLRFRLLRNKSHVFSSGSQGVPFFEYKGAPPDVLQKIKAEKNPAPQPAPVSGGGANIRKDASLPIDLDDSAQCVSGQPCPPGR